MLGSRKFKPRWSAIVAAGVLTVLLGSVPAGAQNDTSPSPPTPNTANQPVNPPPVAGEQTPPGIVTPNTKQPSPSAAAPSSAAPRAGAAGAAPPTTTPSVTGPSLTAPVPALQPQTTPPGGGVTPKLEAKPDGKSDAKPDSKSETSPDARAPAKSEAAVPPSGDASTGKVVTLDARPVVMQKGQATWEDGFKTISGTVEGVHGALAKAGIKETGHPMTVFRETDDNGFKYEVMVPIDKGSDRNAKLPDGMSFAETPAGKVLQFPYSGPYDGIDSTYEAITAYLEEKGYDTKNLFAEEYLNTAKSADDAGLQVAIYVYVK